MRRHISSLSRPLPTPQRPTVRLAGTDHVDIGSPALELQRRLLAADGLTAPCPVHDVPTHDGRFRLGPLPVIALMSAAAWGVVLTPFIVWLR